MRIFCDTNIITEFLERRLQFEPVAKILALPTDKFQLYLSEGGFYTLTFLVDKQLKRKEIFNPERLIKERKILLRVLSTFQVAAATRNGLEQGVIDENFNDLEDSYQYQAALNCDADVLLTINIKDFKDADTDKIKIMTPSEFIESLKEQD